jgi:hypothetical protein
VQEIEEDGELGAVIELTGDDLQRVGGEDGEQLVVGEAQQLLQVLGAQNSWFSPPNTSDTDSSVKMRRIESVNSSAQDRT